MLSPVSTYLDTLAPGSRRSTEQALRVIVGILWGGDTTPETAPWHTMGYADAARVRATLVSRYEPAGANRVLAALRGITKATFLLGQMDAGQLAAVTAVKSVRGQSAPVGRALGIDEVLKLLAACDRTTPTGARDAAILGILFTCGLRRSELVGINLTDLDTASGAVTVRGKGGKARKAFLGPAVLDLIQKWVALRGDHPGPLFTRIRRGGNIQPTRLTSQAIWNVIQGLTRETGIGHASVHDFRRTFVSTLLDKGADLSVVQRLAGHASPVITARYDRRPESAERKAAALLDLPAVA